MTPTQQATTETLLELGHMDRLPTDGYSLAELVMSARPALALDDVHTRRRRFEQQSAA